MNNGLNLNGSWYSTQNLLKFCHEKLNDPQCSDWERKIFEFIVEWHNEKDFIEVQTSGSTGQPKLLKIRKKFVSNSARMTLEFLDLKPGNTSLLCLPANYIAGKMMIVRAILGNLHLTIVEPKGNLTEDISGGIDFAAMIPLQVQKLLESPDGKSKVELIQKLIIGGAPIPYVLEENLRKLNNNIYSTYGMTETISHIAMRRLDGPGFSRYYKLLPNISIEQDVHDCLIINAPYLSENPVNTKDVVQISQHNEFEVLGRLDNMIISGGIKYFPEIIEKKLANAFSDRFLISSRPDAKLGEKIILILETGNPEKYTKAYLSGIYSQTLTAFESPKEVFILEKFQDTGTSKPVRKLITLQAINAKD
jgi:O-succinylbenzoic acid--CoA ligase